MGSITFLVGGARSGKSTLAVQLAESFPGEVTVIATGVAFDDDMAARIERHRAERPPWPTIEEPLDLAAAIADAPADDLLLVDCLTVWAATVMHHGGVPDAAPIVAALTTRSGPSVVISNEVGLGIVPADELSRDYRDHLGRINQTIARAAATTLFMVAGLAMPLHPPTDHLPDWTTTR